MSKNDEKAPKKPDGDEAREAAKAAWQKKKAALIAERERQKPQRDAARVARQEKLSTARAERQNDPERAAKLAAWREKKAAVAAKPEKKPVEGTGKATWLEKRDAVRAERQSTKPTLEKTSAEKPEKGAGKASWLEKRDAVRAERQSAKPVREKKPAEKPEKDAGKAAWLAKRDAARAERQGAKPVREKKPAEKPEKDAGKAAWLEKRDAVRAERQSAKPAREKKSVEKPAEGTGKGAWLEKRDAVRAERQSDPARAAWREKKDAAKAQSEDRKSDPAKGARKTARRGAKEPKKSGREAPKTPETEAAKAARKAARQEAKERKKSQSEAAKSPETEAAKAARKAARQEAKERKKSQSEAAKSPETEAAKAARKAARQEAKERKKSQSEAAKSPETEAAKAARKAAKQEAKERKKSQSEAAKTPETEAAKAARKAARQEAKERKKSQSEAAKSPETEAAKAARKAAKQEAKERKKSQSQAAKTPETEAAKAARKAAKQEAKERRKSQSEAPKTPETEAAKAERKAAKAAAKTAAQGKRKAKTEESAGGLSNEERKNAKREAKAAKKAARRGHDDGEARAVRFGIVGPEAEALQAALTDAFQAVGAETEIAEGGKADLIVHTFDNADADEIVRRAGKIAGERARIHVLVERTDGAGEINRAIARLAAATGGLLVSVPSQLQRFGSDDARALIARSIVGIASAQLKHGVARPAVEAADLAEARALAAQPAEFLAKLRWGNPGPPKAIWTQISQETTEALADSKIVLSEEQTLAIEAKVDWSVELDRKVGYVLYGLDFLTGPLAYWFAKANGRTADHVTAIDAALKQRGTTPNALFVRAAQIILDFLDKHPRAKGGAAWDEQPVIRRARVLALYVLCCRAALKRQIKFNDAAATAIIRALLDHAEALRADDFYTPCSMDGIEQDGLLIGLALVLRGTAYGNLLMEESLGRLKRLQLDAGLSAEGVWMGDTFTIHCTVLASLTGLFGDFSPSDTALLEPFAATAKKMTAFAEAMLKSNGQPPAIDGSRERSYVDRLSGARKTIARAGGKPTAPGKIVLRNRITDTYVFREARYFISHSAQKVEEDSSLVILHAAPPSIPREDPGGVALAFSHGGANLIVRIEAAGDGDAFDPALRNFYRVNGAGNVAPGGEDAKSARMVKSWRGAGWAAAKGIEDSFEGAQIARTVVHMKAAHALIVIDELMGEGGATAFEQSWNIAPEFKAPEAAGEAKHFASADKGVLAVVLAGGGEIAVDARETGAHVRRTLRLSRGVAATLFQWTDEPAEASLAIERDTVENWALVASGKGFSVRLELSDGELRCEPAA